MAPRTSSKTANTKAKTKSATSKLSGKSAKTKMTGATTSHKKKKQGVAAITIVQAVDLAEPSKKPKQVKNTTKKQASQPVHTAKAGVLKTSAAKANAAKAGVTKQRHEAPPKEKQSKGHVAECVVKQASSEKTKAGDKLKKESSSQTAEKEGKTADVLPDEKKLPPTDETKKSTVVCKSEPLQETAEDLESEGVEPVSMFDINAKPKSILKPILRDNYYSESIPLDVQAKITRSIQKTIQQKKVFAMSCSTFSAIKNALIKRGWIQKFECEDITMKTGTMPTDPEGQLAHRLLRGVPLNFIWVSSVADWNDIKPSTLINRFPRAGASHCFTSKIGLNNHLEQAHWYYEHGVSNVRFPRTYSIVTQDDLLAFIEDYIMTACISLLKIVVGAVISGENDHLFKDGQVPLECIDFAIEKCNNYITFRDHIDIDKKTKQQVLKDNLEDMYDDFLCDFYKIAHEKEAFQTATYLQIQGIYLSSKAALQSIQRYWPQIKLDGCKNLWLIKHSNLNCGRGVKIKSTLRDIIGGIGNVKNPRYVIQKYIERPLLIYDTKFDIRQWFLVTNVNPLQIWMYRECYLRFSSQLFSLSDTHESVHLCNNVVQRRYKTSGERHPDLPDDNMWDSTMFQKYLQEIGESEKWDSVVFPGMKESIVATVMASQEDMIERCNSFELYGADFMLTEDYTPWLIEINASPAMGPTTSVTSRMCTQCLRDVIKVVVDWKFHNLAARTGNFVLIHNQQLLYRPVIPFWYPNFLVVGKRMQVSIIKNELFIKKPMVDFLMTRQGKELCKEEKKQDIFILLHKNMQYTTSRMHQARRRKKIGSNKEVEGKDGTKGEETEAPRQVMLQVATGPPEIVAENRKNANNAQTLRLNKEGQSGVEVDSSLDVLHKVRYLFTPNIIAIERMYFQMGMVNLEISENMIIKNINNRIPALVPPVTDDNKSAGALNSSRSGEEEAKNKSLNVQELQTVNQKESYIEQPTNSDEPKCNTDKVKTSNKKILKNKPCTVKTDQRKAKIGNIRYFPFQRRAMSRKGSANNCKTRKQDATTKMEPCTTPLEDVGTEVSSPPWNIKSKEMFYFFLIIIVLLFSHILFLSFTSSYSSLWRYKNLFNFVPDKL